MGWFTRRHVPEQPNIGEPCDRCRKPAQVRVGNDVPEVRELDGIPHAIDRKYLDLVFCGNDFSRNEAGLRARFWQVLDDKRSV